MPPSNRYVAAEYSSACGALRQRFGYSEIQIFRNSIQTRLSRRFLDTGGKVIVNANTIAHAQYQHGVVEMVQDELAELFRETAGRFGHEIVSMEIPTEHVHLFVEADPK